MDSIVEAVFQHADRGAERPVLLFEGQTISYGQLASQVTSFAQALLVHGLHEGDRVALFLENCPDFVVTYLGTHLAGGIVVLVNTQYRQVELSHIMSDAGVRFCVTGPAGRTELSRLDLPDLETLIIVGEDVHEENSASLSWSEFLDAGDKQGGTHELTMPSPDAPAVIGYTSGTTGRAKGALLLQRNLLANIQALTQAWHWSEQDHLLLTLPLFHTHGLMVGMHGTLYTGARVTLRRKFDAASVLSSLRHDPSISLFFGVPTMYSRLLAEAERQGGPVPHPRLFVSGSAPLSPHLFNDFARTFGQFILERYGMTETGMNLSVPYDGERRAGTVGLPFPGQEARIVDTQTRQVLPAGEIGEIEVRGPHVFVGYWNRPEATAEALSEDGWFKTGDLGWRSADGYFTITGRARELIISGGYNIYPREVEDVLATHPGVGEVAVIGLPDLDLGEQVVAVIVPRPNQPRDANDIIAYCRERLASYKKPRRVIFIDALPRNALGKVQKHLLVARLDEHR
ncbi:acyl-CoA synthetase [Ktedonobacter racemifer]|uniref:AMP-dependent synthetase and ligase n=1 Tax=Ktedonobacter racemifer DSM 44963 TaxID=485913 RepID=D6U4W1_KTERA|nr:acyl-CoA synthetase [Ktedonobacter racemifer]EFH81541.1 AMP-dependent synthetase and ligase [Ktedonobacter racemifer DSM 44963]